MTARTSVLSKFRPGSRGKKPASGHPCAASRFDPSPSFPPPGAAGEGRSSEDRAAYRRPPARSCPPARSLAAPRSNPAFCGARSGGSLSGVRLPGGGFSGAAFSGVGFLPAWRLVA